MSGSEKRNAERNNGRLISRNHQYQDPPAPDLIQSGLNMATDRPPPTPKRSPYRAPIENKPKSAVFFKSGELKRSYRSGFRPVFGPGWVFGGSWKKRPFLGLLWASKGHYMGLNSGVFWQMGVFKRLDFWVGESDGFTGVFQASKGEDAQTGLPPRAAWAYPAEFPK